MSDAFPGSSRADSPYYSVMDHRSIAAGDIPTGELPHAIVDAGYTGACVLESSSQSVADSLYDTDLDDLIYRNRKAFNEACKSVPVARSLG